MDRRRGTGDNVGVGDDEGGEKHAAGSSRARSKRLAARRQSCFVVTSPFEIDGGKGEDDKRYKVVVDQLVFCQSDHN